MKIAVCYSGQPRYFKECFDNHQEMIFNNYKNLDIFCHFWYDKNAIDNESFMDCGLPDNSRGKWEIGLINDIQSKLNPKLSMYQKPLNYEVNNIFLNLPIVPHKDYYIPKENIISMFYSLNKCNILKSLYEKENNFKYDCVLRIRSDIMLTKPLSIEEEDLTSINLNSRRHTDYSLNDCIAYGPSELMDVYCNIIFNLIKYKEEGCIENSECFLGWHLKDINKKIKNIKYNLYREIKK